MEARLIEWAGLFFPMTVVTDRAAYVRSVAASETPQAFAEAMDVDVPAELPSDGEWRSLREWAESTAGATHVSTEWSMRFANSRNLTCRRCPPWSVRFSRARLCVEAHGRARLARLPSGTVQILGAEKAFFHHLKTGAPVAQARPHLHASWISRSPRWVRGKIARMLAGKISIAAKVDAFEGEAWGEDEVAKVEQRWTTSVRPTSTHRPAVERVFTWAAEKNEGSEARRTCPRPSFSTVEPCGPEMQCRAPLSTANRCASSLVKSTVVGTRTVPNLGRGCCEPSETLRSCCRAKARPCSTSGPVMHVRESPLRPPVRRFEPVRWSLGVR